MYISDNIIRNRLKNVYFIWGRGKTTVSNRLRDKYSFYVYRTDDGRDRLRKAADPLYQPYMSRTSGRCRARLSTKEKSTFLPK